MSFDGTPKIVQIQYVPRTKKESSYLLVLDSAGQIWFAKNPLDQGFKWHCLNLPHHLQPENEEELVGDPETVA